MNHRSNRWRRRLFYVTAALGIALGCGAYYRHRHVSAEAFSRAIDSSCVAPYCDFLYYYYPQARRIIESDQPVKKYFYSPTFALLLRPIGLMPWRQALHVWTWVQASSLCLLIVASALLLHALPVWTHALMLFLTLTSYPILHNWKWGQANTTFLALILFALALSERGHHKSAGLSLSLAVSARFYPAVYALALIGPRRGRAVASMLVFAALLLVALPILAMGAEHARAFYAASKTQIEQATSTWIAGHSSSEYLPTTVVRLARKWHQPIGTRAEWAAAAAVLAGGNFAAVLWVVHKRYPNPLLWAFCLIALSTPLLVPTSWMHYFVYLPLVQTFVAAQWASLRGRWLPMIAGYLLAWLPSAVLSSYFFFECTRGAQAYAQQGFLLWANLALLVQVYALLLLCPPSASLQSTSPATGMV